MGLREFKIHFDNSYATYEPGQTITGSVVLTIDQKKKFRSIKVVIKGEASVHWEEERSVRRNNETHWVTDYFRGHEEYFRAQFFVLGSASGSTLELLPGTYTYPFVFNLMQNLPSSFEGTHGHIRYTAKATLDRPWKFDQDTKAAFTVISHLDLNRLSNASQPLMLEKSKTFCCLCCGSKPFTINVSIPVRGYVPGQTIPVRVDIENYSGVGIDDIEIKLKKLINYTATTPHRKTKTDDPSIFKISKGSIAGREKKDFTEYLSIPSLPPSNLHNCIIDVEYYVKVEAQVGGCHRNVELSLPIVIGTIPLMTYQMPMLMPQPMNVYGINEFAPSAPPADVPPSYSSVTSYPDIAPPTYEECTFGGTNTLRDHDESDKVIGSQHSFAPRYPVYNFKSP